MLRRNCHQTEVGWTLTKVSVDQALLRAKSHAKKGEMEEAKKLYQSVLQAFPQNVRAQQGLAALTKLKQSDVTQNPPKDVIGHLVALYDKGQLAVVVEQARALTKQYPNAFIVWNVLGAASKGLGRSEDAFIAFKRVTELKPTYADGFNNLGITLQDQGELNEAIAAYNKALSIKPDYASAFYNMGNALKEQGRLDEAIANYNKAISLKPDYVSVWNNLGNVLAEQDKLDGAIEAYSKAISIRPDYAEAYNNIGGALHNQGKFNEAIAAYKKAILINSDYSEAYCNMGNSFKDQGNLDEAIITYHKALSIKPDYAEVYSNMGNALKDQGKLGEAIINYQKALSIKPCYAEASSNMGVTFQEQGQLDEARAAYRTAISIKPDFAEAHRNLSSLITYKADDAQISRVDELLKRSNLKDADRCHLLYTSAKMNEDLGCFGAAYYNYVAGGVLRQKLLSYDILEDRALFAKISEAAPGIKDFDFTPRDNKVSHHTPIFILGMPRSGTTLVEQVLACHSQVHGAGELKFLSRFGGSIACGAEPLSADGVTEFRARYLGELAKLSDGHQFVTDKMPQNFLYIGLILKAFPDAKIIHVKRYPAATCWSNFKHYFSTNGLGYSYDLKHTIIYFKLYLGLINFWDQLYGDRIYHLSYDRLTVDQEPETRMLLEYLGLDWEESCLSPDKNMRSVRTASQLQVREKVYSGSSEAWRKFEPYLDGAFDELVAR